MPTLLDVVLSSATLLQERGFGALEVSQAFADLAGAFDVERVHVYEHDDPKDTMSQRFGWADGAVALDDPALQGIAYEGIGPSWPTTLRRGESIGLLVREMVGPAREALDRERVRALLLAPVGGDADFYGFVVLEDCKNDRAFSESEERALKSFGRGLHSAMRHQRIRANLTRVRESLSHITKR